MDGKDGSGPTTQDARVLIDIVAALLKQMCDQADKAHKPKKEKEADKMSQNLAKSCDKDRAEIKRAFELEFEALAELQADMLATMEKAHTMAEARLNYR